MKTNSITIHDSINLTKVAASSSGTRTGDSRRGVPGDAGARGSPLHPSRGHLLLPCVQPQEETGVPEHRRHLHEDEENGGAYRGREILPDGKIVTRYPECMTPLRKLLSLPDPERFLRDGVTAESLREKEMGMTPVEAAREMQVAKQKLFTSFSP